MKKVKLISNHELILAIINSLLKGLIMAIFIIDINNVFFPFYFNKY